MKSKIKENFKQFIDYTLTDEFKLLVMIFLVAVTISAVCWAALTTAITKNLTNTITEKNNKIAELEKSVIYFSSDAAKYKMISEEYHELITTCQDTISQYETEDGYYE